MDQNKTGYISKIVSLILLSVFVFQTLFMSPTLSNADEPEPILEQRTEINLSVPEPEESSIALIVDKETFEDSSLKSSILTYANTLSNSSLNAQSLIVEVPRDINPNNIARILEKLYREEGLIGTILIGEVPIPILEKDGVSFPSVFPYIDFDNKLWVYDGKIGVEKYIQNNYSLVQEPEIWAGVIKPPVSPSSSEYKSQLNSYLEKTINYHNGAYPAEKKIAYLDYINRPKLGEPSGTVHDFVDRSITSILQMGRYDLNIYKRYKPEVDKLEDCAVGFIPVTINVIEGLARIRPWDPETLRYLILPLVYIPPIPLPNFETPSVPIPDVPDITPLIELTENLQYVENIPSPSLLSKIPEVAPNITEMASIDVGSLTTLVDTVPNIEMPDLSAIDQITSSVDELSNIGDTLNKATDLSSGISSLELPSTDAFDHVIEELNNANSANIYNNSHNKLANISSRYIPQAKAEVCSPLDSSVLNMDVSSKINSFSSSLGSLASLDPIDMGSFGLDTNILSGIGDLSAELGSIDFDFEIPTVDISFTQSLGQLPNITSSLSSLELPSIDIGVDLDIAPLLNVLSVLGDLPALPKMPKLSGVNLTFEIPPFGMPIFLPGLPAPPVIDLMHDFYPLPMPMLVTPPTIPPAGLVAQLKSILKIPDLPELPAIPEIPTFDGLMSALDFFAELPDLSPLEDFLNANFITNFTPDLSASLQDLGNIASLPSFDILGQLGSINLSGLATSLGESVSIFSDLGTQIDDVSMVTDSLSGMNMDMISTDFKADDLSPEELASMQNCTESFEFARDASVELESLKSDPNFTSLETNLTDQMSGIDEVTNSIDSITAIGDIEAPIMDLQEKATSLSGVTNSISAVADMNLDDSLATLMDIGEIGEPIMNFSESFETAMPPTIKRNLETLQNLGDIPTPDLMSLLSISITGYSLPSLPDFPDIDGASQMTDLTGNDTKTILNQDIYENVLPPSKAAWELLCELEGVETDDLNKLIRESSYYNKTDIKDVDREPGMYDKSYLDTFWAKFIRKPNATQMKNDFENGFMPGNTEIMILAAKGDATTIDYDGATTKASDINSPTAMVNLMYGAPFGDITVEDNIGSTQLMNGISLAVVSFTTSNPGNLNSPVNIGYSDLFAYGMVDRTPFLSVFANSNITLGDSIKPNWVESLILLGDPTVTLQDQPKNSDNDYSITFGESIEKYNKNENILLSADFNSDGVTDVLSIGKATGDIQWYRSTPSSSRQKFLYEGIIYTYPLPEGDIETIQEEIPDDFKPLSKSEKEEALEKIENLLITGILEANTGDFNGDGTPDIALTYQEPGLDYVSEKTSYLLNDGNSNFTLPIPDEESNFSLSGSSQSSNERLEENIIAYQNGVTPEISSTRYPITKGDYDNDGDQDLIFSTSKQLQFKENLSNGYQKKKSSGKTAEILDYNNLSDLLKPIDIKEVLPNEGYVDISFYSSLAENLAGYNIYFGQDRYNLQYKQTIPIDLIKDAANPSYRLYELENYKRVYFSITAFDKDGIESPLSEIVSSTPRIELDLENPLAAIRSEQEILINSLYTFDGSESSDNSKHLLYSWDFDIMTDSDGDGNPANDVDSTEKYPTYFYTVIGHYTMRLIVTDLNNNTSETEHNIEVILPKNLFLVLDDGLVLFDNEMSPNLEVTYYKEKKDSESGPEEIVTKFTDQNGFVSLAPAINVSGSKIINTDTGLPVIFFNNDSIAFSSSLPYNIETNFKRTTIHIEDSGEIIADVFFVTDRNQDAMIVDNIRSLTNQTGVYAADYNKNDSYDITYGEGGSLRVVENTGSSEKTYATILPSGGMYLDNNAYLELDPNNRSDFVFLIKLENEDDPLARVYIKPTSNNKITLTTETDPYYSGTYLNLFSDQYEKVDAEDLESGDKVYAIVRDTQGNETPKTNSVKIRNFHTTEDLEDITFENQGKVLGASVSRSQQSIRVQKDNEIQYLSDSAPTFYGRLGVYNNMININITGENNDISIDKQLETGKTGDWNYLLTKTLPEDEYKMTITDKNGSLLQEQVFIIDTTPPDTPSLSTFDGYNKIEGYAEPYSYITGHNYNAVVGVTEIVQADSTGHFNLEFQTNSHHFTLSATDQSGNESDSKKFIYEPNIEQTKEELKNQSDTLASNVEFEENEKRGDIFIAIFILIIGISALIYSRIGMKN